MTDEVTIVRDGAVIEIRFSRPAKKNAITNEMYSVIADALEAAESDDSVRVVLFTAEGDFFTAGNDLKDFAEQGAGQHTGPRHVERFLRAVIHAQKPLVAAVQGHAVGVGTTMLLHCDLVYVAETARLSTPFVDLGLVPEAASSLTIPRQIGHVRAFSLLGLGAPLLGRDAAAIGVANAALPEGEVEQAARTSAHALAAKPAEALRITKRLLRDTEALDRRMREEGAIFAERLRSPEAMQAFQAFLVKRN